MINFVKKNYKAFLLLCVYVIVAAATYISIAKIFTDSVLLLSLTGVIVMAIGFTIGYFYIKYLNKEEKKEDEAKPIEAKSEEANE